MIQALLKCFIEYLPSDTDVYSRTAILRELASLEGEILYLKYSLSHTLVF